ncbi:MAG: asparagine synthase (glutamine-hydrolyzing) [Bacteroidia bacterium]|nr:asparagine synthase (glutamine-hydrolyzing) [Bacteroidia bacterium]
MCGITGIILKNGKADLAEKIVRMNQTIKHRGPDGEGFILEEGNTVRPFFHQQNPGYLRKDLAYLPNDSLSSTRESKIAFGHRRLAIIDLSETGHQPMCSSDTKKWIVYNGEIYNYLELREELKKSGRSFNSQSDTEVILQAYEEWGTECVKRFNGMWAFCIYDTSRNICFASRDRLGVKPFYFINTSEAFAFASEQKALTASGLIDVRVNKKGLYNYLVNGLLEYEEQNFFEGIHELWPGQNLIYNLTDASLSTDQYYKIQPNNKLDHLSEKELIAKINTSFEKSVKLRLRSDVEVGTCLSGGIDSSALAVCISELTGRPLHCFTSVFRNQPFNEEKYADIVAKKIEAKYHKIEPGFEEFKQDLDNLVYSQDVPIWSSSTYAQYKVMALAKEHNIKVVLDGQGADELFAGYHHHFIAKWKNLFRKGSYGEALREIEAAKKTFPNPYLFFLKESVKGKVNVNASQLKMFFTEDFLKSGDILNLAQYKDNVNDQLLDDIYRTRLKSFLKCEDRCGMWHSVESRTPFSDDIELIDMMFSIDGNKKIQKGISKYLLREALKEKLPPEIYSRYDKKGFQTPMQQWVKSMKPQIMEELKQSGFNFINLKGIENCKLNSVFQYEMLFKLLILCRWYKVFKPSV